MSRKSKTAVAHPISFMIGKDSSFDQREMSISVGNPFAINRDWMPQTALVKADALGYRVTRVNDLADMLRWATRELAKDNSNLLILEALMRQPHLPAKIAGLIYPKDQVPVDTSIPVVTFNEFSSMVRKAVEAIDPVAASIPGIVEIVIYTYGRPAIDQHFVLAAREMVDVDLESDLIPDYADIKSAGLSTLLEHTIEGTKASFSTLGAKRIVPKLLFDTIRTTLMVLSDKLIEMRFQWESFDSLAAVAVAKMTGYFDDQPERVGFIKNADVEAFTRNFTLMQASLAYFSGSRSLANVIPALVDAEAYMHNFRGLTNAITQSPLLKQVPLDAFIENTHVTRLFAPNKLLLALIMEPAFNADPTAQVSYFANTAADQGAVLTPMADVETHIRGLFGPISTIAKATTADLHNVIVNAVIEDGDSLAAEAGAALQLSAGASDAGPFPGFAYTPDLLTKNMSDEYLEHVGAALSSYLSITTDDLGVDKPVMTYFFSATTPDLHYLTTNIAAGIAASQDPALVIALKGNAEHPIVRATGSWTTAPQYLDDSSRGALLLNQGRELSIFPDVKNSLDKQEKITFTLSKDVARVMDTDSLTAEVSLYELFGGPRFPDGANVVQVHYNPILSMQTEGVLTMLASLYEHSSNERGRQATVTAAIKLMQPLLQSREFQIAYRGLLAKFAQNAKTPAQRMFLMRSMANIFDVVELQISLVFLILLRGRLLDHDTYQVLINSKIWKAESFRVALATSVSA